VTVTGRGWGEKVVPVQLSITRNIKEK